jgi:ABC-type phosphate/phosphonate transport system substrate-binding protein
MNNQCSCKLALVALASSLPLLMASGPANAQKGPRPIEIRIYSSVFGGGAASDSQVRATMQPTIELMASKIDHPSRIDLEKGTGPDGLLTLGAKVNDGTYHLATVWGLEYGWLRAKYPDLTVMAVVSNGNDAPWRSQLMVRRQDRVPIAKLKGKKLAHIKGAPMMDRLFLEEMVRQAGQDPKGFFQLLNKPHSNYREALLAVKNGQADCVMIDVAAYSKFEYLYPNVMRNFLTDAAQSAPYPAPVIIGRQKHLEKLKPGLWQKTQEVVLRIHDTEEGKQCMRFWRFERFIRPDRQFLDKAEECARKYPMKRLLDAK